MFRAEMAATLILGSAALGTAWSSYQSALWDGEQAAKYAEASALRVQASRADATAALHEDVDLLLFANWLNAYATKHEALADFYTQRFRDEFRPAFSAWLTSQPREHPQSSPFALPEYRLALRDESHRLQAESETAMHEAAHNNDVSDKYVLTTVIFSAAMFLSGIAEHVAWKRGGTLLLALGGLICGTALAILTRYPVL